MHTIARRLPRGRLWLVVALLAATGSLSTGSGSGYALGPIVHISDFPDPFVFVGSVDSSGRGEIAGVPWDGEVNSDQATVRDFAGGADSSARGMEIAVSGDRCVVARVFTRLNPNQITAVTFLSRISVELRCGGSPPTIAEISHLGRNTAIALDHTGSRAAFAVGGAVRVVDLTSGAVGGVLPRPTGYQTVSADYGLDISDDGSVIVGVAQEVSERSDVVAWEGGAVEVVSPEISPDQGWAAFPSVSGDGRWVSFGSTRPLTGAESGAGPWVYVHDRSSGTERLVSDAAGAALLSSISRDGSQVAYGTGPPSSCSFLDVIYKFDCRLSQIDALYGSAPGPSGSLGRENLVPDFSNPSIQLFIRLADISLAGNGRSIFWVSTGADAILGGGTGFSNSEQRAFTRSRDPGLTVDAVAFGDVIAGSSLTRTTTVRNTGRTSVWIGSISSTSSSFVPVGVSTTTFRALGGEPCRIGGSLPPAATCTVQVRFDASGSAGTRAGELVVAETGYQALTASGRLTGNVTALPPRTPLLRITPPSVDFGQWSTGQTSPPERLTVTNVGSGEGRVTTSVTGSHPGDFALTSDGCNGLMLQPGQTCTFDASFGPTNVGSRSASAVASTTGSSATTSLLGEGAASQAQFPQLTASPNPVDFGAFDVGAASGATTVTVTNIGEGAGLISTTLDGDPSEFFVQTNNCVGVTLLRDDSCTMDVVFFPQAGGARSATLTASTVGSAVDIALRGEGIATVVLVADPTEVDYGPVKVGFSTPDTTVTITNIGNAAGVLNTVLEGPHTSDFFVRVNNCVNTNLEPGDSCTMDIAMFPRAGGDRTATLVVSSGTAAVAVPLGGQGRFEPELIASPVAVTERGITILIGQGFPANQPIVVEIRDLDNTVVEPLDVTPDDDGRFRLPFSPLGALGLGAYVLHVSGIDNVYDTIEEPLVVVLPTFQPQGPTGPAFNTNLLVARG